MKQVGLLSKVQPGDFSGRDREGYFTPVTPLDAATGRLWIGLKDVGHRPAITKMPIGESGESAVVFECTGY
jgi:hypothetical protein